MWANQEEPVPDTVKKGATLLVVGFLAFYMLTEPEQFASVLRSLGSWIADGFDRLISFFEALT